MRVISVSIQSELQNGGGGVMKFQNFEKCTQMGIDNLVYGVSNELFLGLETMII